MIIPRRFAEPVTLPDSLDDEPARPALDAASAASLQRALVALTPKQREAVELHFFEGMSQGEIARKLGITQQVVQKRLHGVQRRGKRIGGALPRLRRVIARTSP